LLNPSKKMSRRGILASPNPRALSGGVLFSEIPTNNKDIGASQTPMSGGVISISYWILEVEADAKVKIEKTVTVVIVIIIVVSVTLRVTVSLTTGLWLGVTLFLTTPVVTLWRVVACVAVGTACCSKRVCDRQSSYSHHKTRNQCGHQHYLFQFYVL
jgi:hypothetical protein